MLDKRARTDPISCQVLLVSAFHMEIDMPHSCSTRGGPFPSADTVQSKDIFPSVGNRDDPHGDSQSRCTRPHSFINKMAGRRPAASPPFPRISPDLSRIYDGPPPKRNMLLGLRSHGPGRAPLQPPSKRNMVRWACGGEAVRGR